MRFKERRIRSIVPLTHAKVAEPEDRHLVLRFTGSEDEQAAVPAAVLVSALNGAQRAIWLLANDAEQIDIKSRARIRADVEQRYQLRCEPAKLGSYVMPMVLGPLAPGLGEEDRGVAVLDKFEAIARELGSGNRAGVLGLLPDANMRKRVVDTLLKIVPKRGSGWVMELIRRGQAVQLNERWQKQARSLFADVELEPDRETVNGEVIQIHFKNRQVSLRLKGSTVQIQVSYPETLEEVLLENRQGTIQVTGRVSRDSDGQIRDVFDVESIGPLDLSPIAFREVEFGGCKLHLREALHLRPQINEENPQFVSVSEPELGLDVFAGTIDALMDEVAEDLVMVWKHYARAEDRELAPKALALKQRLLRMVEEVPVGG